MMAKQGAQVPQIALDQAFKMAQSGAPFDPKAFSSMDPSGVSDFVLAFTNDIC